MMLKNKSVVNRLTFMARIMSLAKQVMKNCDDEDEAENFVQEA